MHKISGATGENWGLRPYLGKYFWEAMGRTVLSYGCLGWFPALRKPTVRQKLRRVQRMGFQRMCHFRRGTPNRGLELLLGVPPMEVHIAKTALKAYFRTEGLPPHSKQTMKTVIPTHKGHRQVLQEVIEDHSLEFLAAPMDHVVTNRQWTREFKVDMESMIKGSAGYGVPRFDEPGIMIFTDGSQTQEHTGAGIAFTKNNTFITYKQGTPQIFKFRLRNVNSVYQAETWAIKKSVHMLLELINETRNDETNGDQIPECIPYGSNVTIYSDSQATLKALNSVHIKSKLVSETVETLNNLSNTIGAQVTLRWVKSHSGIFGNEDADKAAAAASDLVGAEPDSPEPPKSMLHAEVDAAATRMWRYLWDNTLGHRQTRYWFPDGPDAQFAFDMIRLPKLICSQVIAFVTGHCHLNRHQALIDNTFREQIRKHVGNTGRDGEEIIPPADPTCSLCKFDPTQKDKEETPLHLMTDCVGLMQLRHDIFGTYNPEPPFKFPVFQIVAFLKQAKIPSFPMQPYLEELYPTAPTAQADTATPQPPLPQTPQPPPSSTAQTQRSPSTEGISAASETLNTSNRNDLPETLSFPEGDKWFHTYLYLSNPLPKPHKEKELLRQATSKPLRY